MTLKQTQCRRLRECCAALIAEAYGAKNAIHELQIRAAGRHTEAQDTERERLRTRYKEIKTHIEGLADDSTALADFIPDRRHFDSATFDPTA